MTPSEAQSTVYALPLILQGRMEWCPHDILFHMYVKSLLPRVFVADSDGHPVVLQRGERQIHFWVTGRMLTTEFAQDFATVVDCIPGTWSEERPKRYEPISVSLPRISPMIAFVDGICRLRNT